MSIREVQTHKDLRAFIQLPYRLYKCDPFWVPPLKSDVRHRLSPSHPFYEHARIRLFLALCGKRVCGRVAAIFDETHNQIHGERCGFFGFFEVEKGPSIADALLSRVESACAEQGMNLLRGPVSPSTNDECGLLVEGFDSPPTFMMPYNPPWYADRLEAFGLRYAKDLHAYELIYGEHMPFQRLRRIRDRLAEREGLQIRPIRMNEFWEEIEIVRSVYNQAWEKNWGFVPLSPAEFDDVAKRMRPIIKAELVLIAEVGGQPVGFSLTLPDVNRALRHVNGRLFPFGFIKLLYLLPRVDYARVITLGVLPQYRKMGLEALLYLQTIENGPPNGLPRGELSWVLETNALMIRGIETLGGKLIKRYRIYEKEV